MSFILMAKAMQIKVGNSARKLVLLKLADNANDSGECVPSYQHIADQCEMSRRSVINHVQALIDMGLLVKFERLGGEKRNRSNRYILKLDGENSAPRSGEDSALGGETASPLSGENSAPRTYHSSEPIKEPIPPNPQGGSADAPKNRTSAFGLNDLLTNNPHGVSEQVLSDWLTCRKALRAPVTSTAWSRIVRELGKCVDAGICPDEALTEAQVAGWRGFQYEWIANRQRSQAPARQSGPDFNDTSWANDMGDGL